jgi:16S rRNA (guanine1207-N2)-methyltransferase
MIAAPFLLNEVVPVGANDQVLLLNSAADAFAPHVARQLHDGVLTLAEDNIAVRAASLQRIPSTSRPYVRVVAFHDYMRVQPGANMDLAALNLFYQPSNAWMIYAMHVAAFALKKGGSLYVVGAKDRGIMTMGKRMQEIFGNVETLKLSKGTRVLRSYQHNKHNDTDQWQGALLRVFADGAIDAGTQLLLSALDVQTQDHALDIGSGAGHIGIAMARAATSGAVTLLDASLTAVAVSQQAVEHERLHNARVLPSDGAQAVYDERFDLVATNPPFHLGAERTTSVAERFIQDAAHVLQPQGRFYLVANRFLKYEHVLRACFNHIEEVAGDTRYKVLRSTLPLPLSAKAMPEKSRVER